MKITNPDCFEQIIQIRDSSVLLYQINHRVRNSAAIKNPFKEKKPAYSGQMSPGASKRLNKAITILISGALPKKKFNPATQKKFNHSISFITLTIPSNTNYTAKIVNNSALEPFLRYFRNLGMNNYVWRAELQERGQIHYHIITDSLFHYERIRAKWNEILVRCGLIEKKQQNANSTDIHSMYKIKNASTYLRKYLKKDDPNAVTVGKIWDCSKNLKTNAYYTQTVDNETDNIIDELLKKKEVRVLNEDMFTMFFFDSQAQMKKYLGNLYFKAQLYYRQIVEYQQCIALS